MAESLTDKLKLSKRDTGDINWGQGANANLDAVDQHAQQATLRPPRTLSVSLGSGAVGANLLGSTTYFYKITAVNAAGETTEGKIPDAIEAQVTESASPVPIILSWETVKGATSYKIYKSTLSGQEKFLASVVGESTAIYTDDGNTTVNGAISVPAANTARTSVSKIVAGTNITISPPDGTGDVTINAAGGGAAGYATVVVAAPTGIAATDTANIQAAINGLPPAGGTVVLREGTYAINAQILLPSAKPVWIVGQGRGTVLADAPSVFMLGIFKGPAAGNVSGLVLCDFLVDGTNSGSGVLELAPTTGQVFENIKILRVHGNRSSRHLHANPAAGTTIKSVEISGCETNLGDKLVLMLGSGTFQRFTIRDNKTFNDINKTDSVLWLRGEQHVIEGNQFFLQAGTIGEGAIGIRDSLERCVIQGNLVRYQGLLAFLGFTPAGAVFRHNVVADNVNHDVDPLILKSIVLTGKGEVSNNVIVGNKLDLLVDLPTAGPSGNNVVIANRASSIQGGTSSDVIASTFLSGLRKLGEASPLTGDVKLEAGSGIALTQDGPNKKITIAAAGGGGGGYSTVIVAAPTGVAATDTTNIQNAVNSLPASGGSVILREGNYVLNGNITLPASKPLNFMGQGKSTRITLDPTFAPGAAPFRGPASGTLEKIVMSDFEYVGGSNQANFLFFSVPAATVWSNMVFERIKFLTCTTVISIGGAGTVKRVWIRDCEAIDCQALVESSTWSDSFILNNYIEKQAALGHPAGIDLGGTNIVCKGNTIVWPDSANAGNVPLRVASTFVKGSIEGNRCVGNRGLLVTLSANIRQSVVADNVFRENTFGTDSILIQGEMSDCVVVGNHCEKDITLNGNAASGGNVIAGNKTASINDNSGATTPNIVARTLVSGVRKLGEAGPLSGDVKLEAGSGIALTQDAPGNKITIAAAGGAGNWTLVANLTNGSFGQTFTPDFTGLSLNTRRSYMLMFELSLASNGAGPNWVALRLNGAAPTTLQQYMLTDQQGVTQDDEGSTFAMAKILKVFPGGGSSVEVSGCIIITGKVNAGFPHAVGWYTITNQSAVEQMHRGSVGLRMNLGSGVDLTSLGLFSNADLNFLVAGSCRMSLYQAQ
ncbi:MAG TPA: hypothetical protein DEB40_03370 [Elusimicrobia bacterium]|nr:hypothetical protein [Elusimicrobiota bacterium]HBT60768.1 hypothetical protein [Elusimicrobiota bacterium]